MHNQFITQKHPRSPPWQRSDSALSRFLPPSLHLLHSLKIRTMIHSQKTNRHAINFRLLHLAEASLCSHLSLRCRLCFYPLPPLLSISAFVSITKRQRWFVNCFFFLCSLFCCWNPSLSVCLQQDQRIGWRSRRRRPPNSSWHQLRPPETAFEQFIFCFVSLSPSLVSPLSPCSVFSYIVSGCSQRFQLLK